MTDPMMTACPRCGGSGTVTTQRIDELRHLGYPVDGWGASPCNYCNGIGLVPDVVAELVPLHDIDAPPRRPPFAARAEFLAVLARLEAAPWAYCRDDAWAAAGILLRKADFPLDELPGLLWEKGRPFLAGNSRGKMLAALVGMGRFSPAEALELAFSQDHPQSPDVSWFKDERAPCFFLRFHELWFRPEHAAALTPVLARRIAAIEDLGWRNSTLVDALKLLGPAAPEQFAADEDAWFGLLTSLPRTGGQNEFPRNNAGFAIAHHLLPVLPPADAARWVPRLLDATLEPEQWDFYVAKGVLLYAIDCLTESAVRRVLDDLVERVRRNPNRADWPRSLSYLAAGLSERTGGGPGLVQAFLAAVAATGVDDAWCLLDNDPPGWISNAQFASRAIASRADQEGGWEVFRELVRLVESVPKRDHRPHGLVCVAKGLKDFSPAWLWEALRLLLERATSASFGWRRDALLEAIARASAGLPAEYCAALAEVVPGRLLPTADWQSRSTSLATFVETLASRAPDVLRRVEGAWLRAVAELPWRPPGQYPRCNAVHLIARNALPRLPAEDAVRWIDALLEASAGCPDWRDFYGDMGILTFAANRGPADLVNRTLERVLARAAALPAPEDRPRAMSYLSSGIAPTKQADRETFHILCTAIAATGREDAWSVLDGEQYVYCNAQHVAWGLATYGGREWSWEAFEELLRRVEDTPHEGHRATGLGAVAKGLRGSTPPWLGRALRLLLERCAALPPGAPRARTFETIAANLVDEPSVLAAGEELWFRLLPEVPRRRGDDYPRRELIVPLAERFLTRLPADDARRWVDRLLNATADGERWGDFSRSDSFLLYFAARYLPAEDLARLTQRLLTRITALPDRQEWPTALSYLTGCFGGTRGTSPELFRRFCDAVAATGLDNAWTLPNDESNLTSNAQLVALNLCRCGSRDWSWDSFVNFVGCVESARLPSNRGLGLACVAKGLRGMSPPWHGKALALLLDRCAALDPDEQATALEEVGQTVLHHWTAPYFDTLLERLIAISVSPAAWGMAALQSWLQHAGKPVAATPAFAPVFLRLLERICAALAPSAAVRRAAAVTGLVKGLASVQVRPCQCEATRRVLDFIDQFPDEEEFRTKALFDAWEAVRYDTAARVVVLPQVLRRLRTVPHGPAKLDGLERLCWTFYDSPTELLALLDAIGQLAGVLDLKADDVFRRTLLARVAAELEEKKAAPPEMTPEAFDQILSELQRLPDEEVVYDLVGQEKYRGSPRVTCQVALLRHFGRVGDPAWRDALLDRVVEHVRGYSLAARRHILVMALLEGLDTIELGPWHKGALEKLASFAAAESQADLSELRRGVVRRLLGLGEVELAGQLAREVVNPQLRSEALADVARALARQAPARAVELLEEVVSPELRGRLAAELAAVPELTADAERVWVLLRASSDDAVFLQRTASHLLGQAPAEEVREFVRRLGWIPEQTPAARAAGPTDAVLDELQAADLITARKRERILSRLGDGAGAALHGLLRKTVLDYLVSQDLISEDDRSELLDGPSR